MNNSELLFPISQNKKLGYIDQNGNLLLQTKYKIFMDVVNYKGALPDNKLIVFEAENGKYGFYTGCGKEVIPPAYDMAYDFVNDRAMVGKLIRNNYGTPDYLWGFIDTSGKQIIDYSYINAHNFYEDVTLVQLPNDANLAARYDTSSKSWILIDKEGKQVADLLFEHGHAFCEGLAAVKIADAYGFINAKGNIVIKPQFEYVAGFFNGVCRVRIRKEYPSGTYQHYLGVIDKTDAYVIEPIHPGPHHFYSEYLNFHEGLALYEKNSRFGFIDLAGNIVVEPIYDNAWKFSQGLAHVHLKNKSGYINMRGEMVVKPLFEYGWGFSEGLAAVQKKISMPHEKTGKKVYRLRWGFINLRGEMVIEPQFNSTSEFHDGLALVTVNDKWAYVNTEGKLIWIESDKPVKKQKKEKTSPMWKTFPCAEMAPTSRSKCIQCKGIIPKDTLRIAIEQQMKLPSGDSVPIAGYLHPECAVADKSITLSVLLINSNALTENNVNSLKKIFDSK